MVWMIPLFIVRIFPEDLTCDLFIFSVQGKPLKFSEVTEEHHEQMTPEEYQAYYELDAARSGAL